MGFQILSVVARILIPLEKRRRQLPGLWPQIVAILTLGVIMFIIDAWRRWLLRKTGYGLLP